MEIKELIEKIKKGEFNRDMDEAHAGGFWDLSGELCGCDLLDENECRQEYIYNTLWEVAENCLK